MDSDLDTAHVSIVDEIVEDLDQAGELIRAVLHRPLSSFTAPDLYRVHGELSVIVPRVGQLVDRVRTQLLEREHLGGLGHDEDADVRLCVDAHSRHVAEARDALASAVRSLAAAHGELSHLRDLG